MGRRREERFIGQETCSIEGCNRPYVAKGYCKPHYAKHINYGSPTHSVQKARRDTRIALIDEAVKKESDECFEWRWELNTQGYGYFVSKGERITAHREAFFRYRNKPTATKKISVAHTCGNRLCINPRHLIAQNRIHRDKLGDDQAWEVFCSDKPRRVLAKEYKVSVATIGNIQTMRSRANVILERLQCLDKQERDKHRASKQVNLLPPLALSEKLNL